MTVVDKGNASLSQAIDCETSSSSGLASCLTSSFENQTFHFIDLVHDEPMFNTSYLSLWRVNRDPRVAHIRCWLIRPVLAFDGSLLVSRGRCGVNWVCTQFAVLTSTARTAQLLGFAAVRAFLCTVLVGRGWLLGRRALLACVQSLLIARFWTGRRFQLAISEYLQWYNRKSEQHWLETGVIK